jgi:hypothetical protein
MSISTSATASKSPKATRKTIHQQSEAEPEPAIFKIHAYQPPADPFQTGACQYLSFRVKNPGSYDLTILSDSDHRLLDREERAKYKRHKNHWVIVTPS